VTTLTIAKAVTSGLRAAMEKDPKVILMGEDIGKLGGVFRVTEGLQKDFGEDRVMDTPLAEAGIVGTAIGMALRGYRPVVEIQFDGFVYPAFDHIVSQVAKMRARSLGTIALPMVIRIPVGGGITASPTRPTSRIPPVFGSSASPTQTTRTGGSSRRSRATTRSCSTSPSGATGTRGRSTCPGQSVGCSRPRSCGRAPTARSSPMGPW